MAEEDVVREAKEMGWVPKEEYKGAPEHWVDADVFVEKGRQVLPILRSNNQKLIAQVTAQNQRISSMENSLKAATTTIELLEKSHEDDVKEQVQAAKKELKAELARASREGDHEAVAELTEKIADLNVAEKEAKAEKPKEEKKLTSAIPPEIQAWFVKNPDFVKSPRRLALAQAVATEFREAGDTTVGSEFMDRVADEVEKILGGERGSKVSGGNGGGGRSESASSGSGKTYADLPAEAKAICDKQAVRLVGPNRIHKDVASWRKSYVEQFFSKD